MELPGINKQQLPATQSVQGQQSQGQKTAPFPSSQEEALKFSNDIQEVLFTDQLNENIVKQLQEAKNAPKGQSVGLIAGNILGDRVADVVGQTKRKVNMGMIIGSKGKPGALQAVINSLSEIAKDNGIFEMSKNDKIVAFKEGVAMLDKAGTKSLQQGVQQ